MKAWKWILLGTILVTIYIVSFIWVDGWIVASILAPLFVVLLFVPVGGTWKQAISSFNKNAKEGKLKEYQTHHEYINKVEKEKVKVAIGLSGGVDSAVAAYLLQQSGYEVIGFFMKNWNREANNENINMEDFVCQSESDYKDAKAVADFLGIELKYIDFSSEYWEKVFKPFLDELKQGLTPNPDILCNRYVKFKKFIEYVNNNYPDIRYIATGHYASIKKTKDKYFLQTALDETKDQTYFLSEINKEVLSKLNFPLANIRKEEVRKIALKIGLPNATKPDSVGICFIGERKFDQFLENWIDPKPGDIVDIEDNKVLGKHKGVYFYTIGQRKGLNLGGMSEGYFVTKKDIEKNILYVSKHSNQNLWTNNISAKNFNWLVDQLPQPGDKVLIKTRHSIEKHFAYIKEIKEDMVWVETFDLQKAITPGQELVIYDQDICLGGGQIISS